MKYTVKYDFLDGVTQYSETVYKGVVITLPTPTRAGYRFVGWYTDSGFKTLAGKGGASYKVTGNVTLFGKWVKK